MMLIAVLHSGKCLLLQLLASILTSSYTCLYICVAYVPHVWELHTSLIEKDTDLGTDHTK